VIEEMIRFDYTIALLPPFTHASDLRRFCREEDSTSGDAPRPMAESFKSLALGM